MLTRNQWKRIVDRTDLDRRVIASILLGEPVKASTRKLVELAAKQERIVLPADFWPADGSK